MKSISNITTAELERLERELENPKTVIESAAQLGVKTELTKRWGSFEVGPRNVAVARRAEKF